MRCWQSGRRRTDSGPLLGYAHGDPVNFMDPSGRGVIDQELVPDSSTDVLGNLQISLRITPTESVAAQPGASTTSTDPYSAASASGTGLAGVDVGGAGGGLTS